LKPFNALRQTKRLHGKLSGLPSVAFRTYAEIQASWGDTASFCRMLIEETRRGSLGGRNKNLIGQINPKDAGVRFAREVGIPALSLETYTDVDSLLNRVRESNSRLVVKPQVGYSSKGIFIVHGVEDIFDLGRFERLRDFNDFARRIAESERAGWCVEPFLPSLHDERCPAHDLKFYSFYGRIGLVLEVRRHPKIRYCWWNADGEQIGKGKHGQRLFSGQGFSDLEKGWAIKLSSEIPAPFMRIDFLRSSEGSFFGEFTPRPGGFEYFPHRLDKWMGELYLEAQDRLLDDLWNGKRFDHFRTVTARPAGLGGNPHIRAEEPSERLLCGRIRARAADHRVGHTG
jgi:hypothetical protein